MTQPRLDRPTHKRTPRCAFTLIEMMVAMALTMLLILALTQMFNIVGDNFGQTRAALELSGKMRSVEASTAGFGRHHCSAPPLVQ